MTNQNCKELVKANLPERMEEMKNLLKLAEYPDKFNEELNNIALSVEYNHQFKSKLLLLSWGGPADGFLFSKDGKKIKYYFQDWGDYAEIKLTGKNLTIMQNIFDLLDFKY